MFVCYLEQVELSGPVNGKAEWPSELKPVAWNDEGDMVRMKLGLYHSTHNVADGEVSGRFLKCRTTVDIARDIATDCRNTFGNGIGGLP